MTFFMDDLIDFIRKADTRPRAAFVGSVMEVKTSIQLGSELTGAPGQVVADYMGGALRSSWQLRFPTPTRASISTSSPYAPQNEDGVARPGGGPYIQRSKIGGRWSVALTLANFDKIVDAETAKVKGKD